MPGKARAGCHSVVPCVYSEGAETMASQHALNGKIPSGWRLVRACHCASSNNFIVVDSTPYVINHLNVIM